MIEKNDRFIFYGAGNLGVGLAQKLMQNGFNPVGFLDSRCTGKKCGLPVFLPENAPEEWKDLPVLISVFNPQANSSLRIIESLLHAHNFKDLIAYETFFQKYSALLNGSHFWLTNPSFYQDYKSEITETEDLFKEDDSRKLYQAEVRHRLGGNWKDVPPMTPVTEQYFDHAIIRQRHFKCFADIGAYTGDTLANLISQRMVFDRVLAFEPDMHNLSRLCEFVKTHSECFADVTIIPVGVGSENKRLSFSEGNQSSSRIDHSGLSQIPVVALDEICLNVPIDFVKMDIEGAEMDALSGMRRIIEKNHPTLAISVYHRPEDLFAIPLYLHRQYSGYNYYLRSYGEHGFETVLYAIPDLS